MNPLYHHAKYGGDRGSRAGCMTRKCDVFYRQAANQRATKLCRYRIAFTQCYKNGFFARQGDTFI